MEPMKIGTRSIACPKELLRRLQTIANDCCIGLLKMKWRRLNAHRIKEFIKVVPLLITCACILHNICIDAGDVELDEDEAMRSEEEMAEELEERKDICRIAQVARQSQADIRDNAAALVARSRAHTQAIYDYWLHLQQGDGEFEREIDMARVTAVFGPTAFDWSSGGELVVVLIVPRF